MTHADSRIADCFATEPSQDPGLLCIYVMEEGMEIEGDVLSSDDITRRLIEASRVKNGRVVLLTQPWVTYGDFISALDFLKACIENNELNLSVLVRGNSYSKDPNLEIPGI